MMIDSSVRSFARTRHAARPFDVFARPTISIAIARAALVLCVGFVALGSGAPAHAELRDYTVRWIPSPSDGVEGYELAVGTSSGATASTFDLGLPAEQNGQIQSVMELEDSVDLYLRLRAYGSGVVSDYSNEIVVAAAPAPGEPGFGVSKIDGASGVVSGDIVVVAQVYGATESVQFLLNGSSYRIENALPYSIESDDGDIGTERPFDTTQLPDGEHTITAVGYSGDSAGGVEGASVSATFYVDNQVDPIPDPDPVPDPTPDPDPDTSTDPDPVPDPIPSGPAGAVAGLQGTPSGDIVAVHVDGSTTLITNSEFAAAGDLRPDWCDLDGDGDQDLVIGFGPGSRARVLLLELDGLSVTDERDMAGTNGRYISRNGETFPSCGDIDGDGASELVVGLGGMSIASMSIFDDRATGYAPMQASLRNLLRSLPFVAMFGIDYARDGVARPHLGDIDGDGIDEIVVGRSEGAGGTISIFDDATTGFALFEPLRLELGVLEAVTDAAYQASDGTTRIAVGDLDGDGIDEIAVTLMAADGPMIDVLDDATQGFARMVEDRTGRPILGAGVPSVADIDGDGFAELVVGPAPGASNASEIRVLDDLTTGFSALIWTGDAEGIVVGAPGDGAVFPALEPRD